MHNSQNTVKFLQKGPFYSTPFPIVRGFYTIHYKLFGKMRMIMSRNPAKVLAYYLQRGKL